jgi:hypothetical protein
VDVKVISGNLATFAFHGGLDLFAVFLGLAGVNYGDRFGGDLQTHGGFVDLLRIELHLAGNVLGGDQVIVAEGFEGAFFADVNLQFALLGINRVGRALSGPAEGREDEDQGC